MDVDIKVSLTKRQLKKDITLENAVREYPMIRSIFLDRIDKGFRILEDLESEHIKKHGFCIQPRMQELEV